MTQNKSVVATWSTKGDQASTVRVTHDGMMLHLVTQNWYRPASEKLYLFPEQLRSLGEFLIREADKAQGKVG